MTEKIARAPGPDERQVRLHVYRLPAALSTGYCFDAESGTVIGFLNVDFFDVPWNIDRDAIVAFIKKKRYFDSAARFLIIAEADFPTLTFTVEPRLLPRAQEARHGR